MDKEDIAFDFILLGFLFMAIVFLLLFGLIPLIVGEDSLLIISMLIAFLIYKYEGL